MVDNSIKVGFCVAYDWGFLAEALPLVYHFADTICLSVDSESYSWANQSFDWDEAGFMALIGKIDKAKKIKIYKHNFHLIELTALQNEVRQRNLMAVAMGKGGWHIQLDCDEYFVDFEKFVDYLKHLPDYSYTFNVSCIFITLFKKGNNGFLYVCPEKSHQIEHFQVATRYPHYEHGRRNGFFNVHSNFLIIHQSWARNKEEIKQKLLNWGHVNDFNVHAYFQFWESVGFDNYQGFANFHPMTPESWPTLKFIESRTTADLISAFHQQGFPTLNRFKRFLKNSRIFSKINSLVRSTFRKISSGQPLKWLNKMISAKR